MIGRIIGQYRIVAQIGRGGSGIVYKAVDETLNREVAIKILNPDLADTDILKRFRAEATTLAKLNHPEIATIYELLRSQADLVMVMEFVRGETLDRLSDRLGPMAPDRAAYLIDRILSALEHAHRAGIVHRDMKPANVMVTETGGIKIMDFGIARVRGADQVTGDSYLMGTPAYMPPEQVLGQEVDGRADLYSVGVIFYRLVTGALPFKAETPIGMLQQQIADQPAPLELHRDGLPEWCGEIIGRAMAKAPADRFQTAEEFREALANASGIVTMTDLSKEFAVPESERIPAPVERVPTQRIPMEAGVSPSVDTPTMILRRHLVSAVAMFAFVAISGAVITLVVMHRGRREPPKPVSAVAHAPRTVAAARVEPAVAKPVEPERPREKAPARTAASRKVAPAARASVKHFAAPLVFDTRALIGNGRTQRERDAKLVLADGKVNVTAADDSQHPFHTVPYDEVTSISYSHGRNPMWNSPYGPLVVTRADGGAFGAFGIFMERHWISLHTKEGFVVLRVNQTLEHQVLSALEERTGRTPQFVTDDKKKGAK